MAIEANTNTVLSERSNMEVRPQPNGLGTEVLGADLAALEPGKQLDSLRKTFLDNGVFFLRPDDHEPGRRAIRRQCSD